MASIAPQTATGFRLGVLGAGRLGEAVARTWFARTGKTPLVWSRNHSSTRIAEAAWVGDWTSLLEAHSFLIAIPGKALLQLAANNEAAGQFTGNVFCAAASLSPSSLQRVFPRATVFCVSPFLIDGVNSIPMLVLRPDNCAAEKWSAAKAELELFGEVDVVDDEEIFSQLSLLGASWPGVVLACVQAAAAAGLQGIEDVNANRIGNRLFFRAMQSLIASRARGEQDGADEIATPGGITERGLQSLGEVTSLFETVFQRMRARAAELRA